MTPEEQNPHPSVHHQTIRGARLALARKEISQGSYKAVLRGELSLAEAKVMGRDRGPDTPEGRISPRTATEIPWRTSAEDHQDGADTPPQPVSRISKDERGQECWCGCRQWTKPNRRWLPGHDQRAKGIIKRAVREGRVAELSPQLKEYGAERGLI